MSNPDSPWLCSPRCSTLGRCGPIRTFHEQHCETTRLFVRADVGLDFCCDCAADDQETRARPTSEAPNYASVSRECGGDGRAQFLKAFDGLWPIPSNFAGRPQPGNCGLDVRRHGTSVEFGQAVIVIPGRHEHLLLVGPIADAMSSAMACYASTVLRGRPCKQ